MHLEQEVCRLQWDVGFVIGTTLEIGVQLQRLLDVYDQLFKTRVRDTPSVGLTRSTQTVTLRSIQTVTFGYTQTDFCSPYKQ